MKAVRLAAFMLALIMAATGCAGKPENVNKVSAVGFFFDTVVTLNAYGATQKQLNSALAQCVEYENAMSKTIEGSDVWNINHAQGKPVKVSRHTLTALKKALEICEASGGAFDITIAPCSGLWNFTDGKKLIPDAEKLKRASELVDYAKLSINGDEVTLPAGMEIDLGGIAKGYIADQLREFCETEGIKAGLINLGGNVVVFGRKPDGTDWRVGVQDPKEPTGTFLGALPLEYSAVTSGINERGFEVDGVTYHHILDPDTGWPVQNELAAVTILTKSSMLGDALSTACFALGEQGARRLLENYPDAEAVFVDRENNVSATNGVSSVLTLLR